MDKKELKKKTKNQLNSFLSDKRNVYMLLLVIMIPLVYELFRFTPLESLIEPNTLNDFPTRWLQEKLGTDTVFAYFASYYYFIPHVLIMAGLAPMFLFAKRRPPWFYLSIAMIIFIIDTSFYFIYPVAPPIRLDSPLIEPIRINIFPFSDTTISVHYSALPSGHIFISFLGLLIAYIEKWKKTMKIYAFNTIIMTFVIVYTGDHYVEDAIASIILVLGVYALIWIISKKKGWIIKNKYGMYVSSSLHVDDHP